MEDFGLKMRRACSLIGLSRTSFRYVPKPDPLNEAVKGRIKELAEKRKRFGHPRLHTLIRREGILVNHKRTERIYYKELKLSLRIRRRRKRASCVRVEVPRPEKRNHIWSMDFMRDSLSSSRQLKLFTLIDEYTRKCLKIDADTSITGRRVTQALEVVSYCEGLPEMIIIDNGPEFISNALDKWAYERGIRLFFITPGKPVENTFIESFNGRFRDECLNMHWFMSLAHARRIVEDWRIDYNTERPHSSLNDMTPEEFIRSQKVRIPEGIPSGANQKVADYSSL